MPYTDCLICKKQLYVKPSHFAKGWGKYCSIQCRSKAQIKGETKICFICKKAVYKSQSDLKKSKSGLYFCSKTCQTIWRNKILYIGQNHTNWKSGITAYRRILSAKDKIRQCSLCKLKDERVLIVHHIDHNRKNNDVSNLTWLCCNCHFLTHHYPEVENSLKEMVAVVQW